MKPKYLLIILMALLALQGNASAQKIGKIKIPEIKPVPAGAAVINSALNSWRRQNNPFKPNSQDLGKTAVESTLKSTRGNGLENPAAALQRVTNGLQIKNPGMEVLEATRHSPFESMQFKTFEENQPQWNSMESDPTSGGDELRWNIERALLFRRFGFLTNEPLDSIGMKRLSDFRDSMANRVIGERVGCSRYENIEIKGNAMLWFAVVSDAQATIDLLKQFLYREYGGVIYWADDYAIMTCIMLGEEGENYLRELAEQREDMGLMVSAGWAFAKEKVAGLKLSYGLIEKNKAACIDAKKMKEWEIARIIAQKKINQTLR